MTACPCLNDRNMTDMVLKAKRITFDTSVLKHTVMKVFAKSDAHFICPIGDPRCSNCASTALKLSLQKFENRGSARKKVLLHI